jgi:hypothetical protein
MMMIYNDKKERGREGEREREREIHIRSHIDSYFTRIKKKKKKKKKKAPISPPQVTSPTTHEQKMRRGPFPCKMDR